MTSESKKNLELIEEIRLLKERVRELESGRAESSRAESGRAESGRAESGRAESGRAESGHGGGGGRGENLGENLGENRGENLDESKDESLFLSAVLDNIEEAIVICDGEGRIIKFNQAARQLHGVAESAISPDQWPEYYDLFKTDGVTPLPKEEIPLYRALQGEHVQNAEIVVAPVNRKPKFLVCNGQALRDEKGNITGAVIAMHDITGYKQAQETLKEKEAFNRLVLDHLPLGIAINTVHPKVEFIYMNENFWKNYRTTREALQEADSFWDVVYGEDPVFREEIKTRVEKDFASGDPETMYWEDVPFTRNGEGPFYICARNIPLKSANMSISTVWDVTHQKRTERALRESEERYRRLFETMAQGVIYQTRDGSIISANPAAEEILGRSFEQMSGITSHDSRWEMILEDGTPVPGDEHPTMVALRTGKKIGPALRGIFNPKKEGYVWLRIHAIPLFEKGSSEPSQVYATFSDITEQKKAEIEKKKLQQHLAHAQKLESVGRLAGGVAHDFNNMLGIILGHTDLAMKDTDPSSTIHSDLKEIKKTVRRSAELVKQLLAFARKQNIDPEIIDLNVSIEKILKMLRRLIGEDISLAWVPCKKLWPVKLDPSQLDQILANLFINARDAIPGVGKVTIETDNVTLQQSYSADRPGFEPGDFVMIAVSDNGVGIDKEILDHIFDPFFTTKDVGQGTGLGLATVYGIVKQNNGYINVYSEKGEGTTFKIYIPRSFEAVEQDRSQSTKNSPAVGCETVLVVEDEPMLLQMAKTVLDKHGYSVLFTGSPVEAIKIAEEYEGEIELLLTDVVMPSMNGRDLAARLKSTHPNLKVLFMSGYTSNVVAHHGILEKGIHFLQKPFSVTDLTLKVREALENAENAENGGNTENAEKAKNGGKGENAGNGGNTENAEKAKNGKKGLENTEI